MPLTQSSLTHCSMRACVHACTPRTQKNSVYRGAWPGHRCLQWFVHTFTIAPAYSTDAALQVDLCCTARCCSTRTSPSIALCSADGVNTVQIAPWCSQLPAICTVFTPSAPQTWKCSVLACQCCFLSSDRVLSSTLLHAS